MFDGEGAFALAQDDFRGSLLGELVLEFCVSNFVVLYYLRNDNVSGLLVVMREKGDVGVGSLVDNPGSRVGQNIRFSVGPAQQV